MQPVPKSVTSNPTSRNITALDYTVIIVGDKEHPEVDGLLGYAGGRGIIISTRKR
jgi:4-hydroxy-3-methylbut-2-enyl diphosphate reductase